MRKTIFNWQAIFLIVFLAPSGSVAAGQQEPPSGTQTEQPADVVVPSRPAAPLFTGKSGAQESELTFVPVTRKVTLKIHVEDPSGYFLPNIRPENFAVYEDGVRQKDVDVQVEHAAVSVALLMEFGGRFHEFNKELAYEVPTIGRHLGEVLDDRDREAAFKYASKLEMVIDFTGNLEAFRKALDQLGAPEDSEVNLYDALLEEVNRTKNVEGRRATVLVSTGLDTFSKANFEQIRAAVRGAHIPIYAIGLEGLVHREAALYGPTAPFARIDWDSAEKRLETIAQASGGRAYGLESDSDVPAVYDDIMENLRMRYVISYVSSNPSSTGPQRKIRVELVDSKSGRPLKIRDTSGKVIAAGVFVQQTYVPSVSPSD